MQYSVGRIGRVYAVRIDDGEDMIASLQKFAKQQGVTMALIHILGALRDGKAVTGPEIAVIPPVPHFERFEGGWELIAVATLYPSSEGPKLHIHASTGREKAVLTGCIREKAQVYLTIEAVVIELDDMAASRKLDDKSGQYLLKLAEKA